MGRAVAIVRRAPAMRDRTPPGGRLAPGAVASAAPRPRAKLELLS
jgi:hypothetical protein